jgi:hypothetical protein
VGKTVRGNRVKAWPRARLVLAVICVSRGLYGGLIAYHAAGGDDWLAMCLWVVCLNSLAMAVENPEWRVARLFLLSYPLLEVALFLLVALVPSLLVLIVSGRFVLSPLLVWPSRQMTVVYFVSVVPFYVALCYVVIRFFPKGNEHKGINGVKSHAVLPEDSSSQDRHAY